MHFDSSHFKFLRLIVGHSRRRFEPTTAKYRSQFSFHSCLLTAVHFLLLNAAYAAPKDYFPIKSIESNAPISDFHALSSMIHGAEVVGLGEPTHGSHAFHQARLKFVQYLVTVEGFRALGFESSWSKALSSAEYVKSCRGDRKRALMGLQFIAWMDTSVLELLDWLCHYNVEHPGDPVRLFGFDVQYAMGDKRVIRDFFDRVDPSYYVTIKSQIDASARMKLRQTEYEGASSRSEVFFAKTALTSLGAFQLQQLYGGSTSLDEFRQGFESRDAGMANIFQTMRSSLAGNPKTVIYAHNYHIADNSQELPGAAGAKSMGTILSERLGNNYAAIGSIGYRVELNGTYFKWNPPPTDPRSVELNLHQTGESYLLVDTKSSLFAPGVAYPLQDQGFGGFSVVPARHYSGFFFTDYSAPLEYAGP